MTERDEQAERRAAYGVTLGSIGDLCMRVGYDVRDLIMDGYTWDQIYAVANGVYTLEELFRRGPAQASPQSTRSANEIH